MDQFWTVNTALGLIAGLILGMAGNYLFEGYGLKTRAAKRSKKRSQKRSAILSQRLTQIENWRADYIAFAVYLLGRLFLVTALWLFQEAFDYLLGLLSNTNYSLSFIHKFIFVDNPDLVNTAIADAGSIIGMTTLLLIGNMALRTYVTWRRVQYFDQYATGLRSQLEELRVAQEDA